MQNKYQVDATPVLTRLRSDIVTCALPPGTPIREAEASKRYGASRTPVREAFVELSCEGFVVLEKNKGAVVAQLDAATVFAVFEARIPAEKAASALAAQRATPDELASLNEYRAELNIAAAAGDMDAHFAIDRAVHDAISSLSRNPYIERQVAALRAHTARCWHHYKDRGLREAEDVEGLISIIEAVTSRDPEAAAEAMRLHLTRYLLAFKNMLTAQIEVMKWV